ncbi:MAG: hypothetical protein IT355_10750 [Gemmatimonadaceae bacterium]|nr:hypothetical protein [Gemmatimonadaceae bacterium]
MPVPRAEPRRGQSFVGLLLVLLVLTLLTAFAAPRVDLSRFRSDAIARQAVSVFASAARTARQRRTDVVVRVDSARRRLGTLEDRNGNGGPDGGEREVWTDLDPTAELRDPPVRLPLPAARGAGAETESAAGRVAFHPAGGASADLVLYLTSDPAQPSAWRAVQVSRRTGGVQLWRFDGARWTRGRT